MHYLEILKYLFANEYKKNPPEFNKKLETLESMNPLVNLTQFLSVEGNKELFLTYVSVSFNWIMKSIFSNEPDLYDLTNLQMKIEAVRGKFDNDRENHYINMIYVLLSSVALYYCDKSNEALSEFNKAMGDILSQSSKWWMTDFRDEFMESKSPSKFIRSISEPCNSCSDCKGGS
jgi:hypothetical protein